MAHITQGILIIWMREVPIISMDEWLVTPATEGPFDWFGARISQPDMKPWLPSDKSRGGVGQKSAR